ncbi:RDD family protein [Streptomyces sp. NPDC003717]|uniref:RDD family protein n=1 Tax=Streptomyces sp. NPDC003717 TaxID=3154276 RepID=UPI0033A67589
MSAPTPAPGDDRPREGYYPDPSIPGYVRYWNGASWVPGTSRPAPRDGEPLVPPAGAGPAVEETGPHFFDEDPVEEPAGGRPAEGPPAAGTWQSGEPRRAWPQAAGADPRVPAPAGETAAGPEPGPGGGGGAGNPFVFRRPAPEPQPAPAAPPPATPAPSAPAPSDEGTLTFRAVAPRPGGPGFAAGKAAAARAAAPASPATPTTPAPPAVPRQPTAPVAPTAPVSAGPGGGQSSWAQQVHRLAGADGDERPVAPWKPPAEDVFQAAARRQAAARPAALGKRLAARLVDTVALAAVTAGAALPLGTRALDHMDEKIDQAKQSGRTVTVWLLDGTTCTYLGAVLAVLLLFGVVYEALPTARWGRTLGKRLLGLEVRDIEAHEPPTFGAALRRWLVYSVPGLLAVGLVGVLWCLFDRPWRQCWHDKAARTFVAG